MEVIDSRVDLLKVKVKVKVKLSLQQTVEAHTVVRRRDSRIRQLTDGDEAVSLMLRAHFKPRKIPGTHFC
jgi:hypothetical protein